MLLRAAAAASRPVCQPGDAGLLGAVGAAEDRAVVFDAVAEYFAAAMGAHRGQGVNRAFERVENVPLAVHGYRERGNLHRHHQVAVQ